MEHSYLIFNTRTVKDREKEIDIDIIDVDNRIDRYEISDFILFIFYNFGLQRKIIYVNNCRETSRYLYIYILRQYLTGY